MAEIITEITEKTPIKVAEKFTELDYPSKMYILGAMMGILSKSNAEQNQNKSA